MTFTILLDVASWSIEENVLSTFNQEKTSAAHDACKTQFAAIFRSMWFAELFKERIDEYFKQMNFRGSAVCSVCCV